VTTLAEATVRFGAGGHAARRELKPILLARGAAGSEVPVIGPSGELDPDAEVKLSARLGGRPRRSRSGMSPVLSRPPSHRSLIRAG
jgi:hypothetical protein